MKARSVPAWCKQAGAAADCLPGLPVRLPAHPACSCAWPRCTPCSWLPRNETDGLCQMTNAADLPEMFLLVRGRA